MTKRVALISGVNGQVGSYLAEHLLDLGYKVLGMVRRRSTPGHPNLADASRHPNVDQFKFVQGDMTDEASLRRIIEGHEPDEIYNLAAQSFVAASWSQPMLTNDVNYLGFLRILEICRESLPEVRIYQASSSEMFGNQPGPQNENTRMTPRSPYGVSKLAAHRIARVYRESFGMFVASGVMFNHESISAKTPLLIRRNGTIDISSPEWIAPYSEGRKPVYKSFNVDDLEVWDGTAWAEVLAMTGRPVRRSKVNDKMLHIVSRSGLVETTANHNLLTSLGEKVRAKSARAGDSLLVATGWPQPPNTSSSMVDLAKFLGYMAADGYVAKDGKRGRYTKNDDALRQTVGNLWRSLFGGSVREEITPSGYANGGLVHHIVLRGANSVFPWLRELLYMPDKTKRVPRLVLNSDRKLQELFLSSYYEGDGLKGYDGKRWAVKTNSPCLALGLIYLLGLRGMPVSVYLEERDETHRYYQLNGQMESGNNRATRDPSELRKIVTGRSTKMVYDLETTSERFMAGVGRLVISNSPRRGHEFVTRKIAAGFVNRAIYEDGSPKVKLGYIDSYRDWGYAPDYARAQHLMLQIDEPMDMVIATGKSHSVREFLVAAHAAAGLDGTWEDHVEIDQDLYRPAEVYELIGDPFLANHQLNWQPEVDFEELVHIMVQAELDLPLL